MAWSGAITLSFSTTSGGSGVETVTSASFTPPADSLEFVQHSHSAAGHATAPDVQISNTGGLTFGRYVTEVRDFAGANDIQSALLVAPVGGSPSSMTVTVDPFPTTDVAYQSMLGFAVTEGEILQGPVGRISEWDGATTHTTAALPVATTSGNLVIAGFLTHTTTSTVPTEPDGFTLLGSTASAYEMTTVFYSTAFVGTEVTCLDLGESLYVSASWIIEIETPSAPPTGAYTELEWNVGVQAPAVADEVYEFRVYAGASPLTDYPVTAQLSVESAGGGVNYNETGRSITIAATTTATDQADWKSNVGLSIPVVATTTETSQADFKELGLSFPVVATTTTTAQYDNRELALSIPIAAATTLAVDQADFKEVGTAVVGPAALLSYNFSESGTTVTDRSGNGRDAVMLANTTPTDLHSGGELSTTATLQKLSYDAASDAAARPVNASVTLKMRMPGASANFNLWSRMRSVGSSTFNLYVSTGTLSAVVRGVGGGGATVISDGALSVGTTYYLALTYDGTTTRLYRDGVEVSMSTTTAGNLDWTGTNFKWQSGDHEEDTIGGSPMFVDDIRFFDFALTAPQVAAFVGVPVPDTPAGGGLLTSIAAVVTATDVHNVAGAGYNETNRSILITAAVTVPTEQADFKDLALTVPGVATVTLPLDRYERYDLALSIPTVATVTTPTDRANRKELALSVPVTATVTATDLIKRGELGRSIPVVATVTETNQADWKSNVGLSVPVVGTVTVPTDKRKTFETALSVPVVSTTIETNQADFKNLTLDLSITAFVTCTDNQQSPGHYEDTGLPINGVVNIATVIEQADYKDLARSIPVVASTAVTALKHQFATGLSIPVVATAASTALHKRFEPLALPITATALLTDQADFKDLTRGVNVAATVTITEGFGGAIETGRQILVTATVGCTDRADFNDLVKALDVVAGVSLTDQADYHQLLAVLIVATIKATDLQRYASGVILNTALALYLGEQEVVAAYVGDTQVWP